MQDFALNRRFWYAVLAKARANLYVEASRNYLTVAWWVLEPLLMMLLYWIVFGAILRMQGADFAVFLIVGLVPWQWFDRSVNGCSGSIKEGARILSKVPINRLFFPTSMLVADLLRNLLVFTLLVAFLAVVQGGGSIRLLSLVATFLSQLLLIGAVGIWVALLIPFVPDLRVVVNLALRVLMFASGVFYPISVLPEAYQAYFFWNPMARLLDEYRNALLRDQAAQWEGLLVIAVVSALLIAAAVLFSDRFGDRYLKQAL